MGSVPHSKEWYQSDEYEQFVKDGLSCLDWQLDLCFAPRFLENEYRRAIAQVKRFFRDSNIADDIGAEYCLRLLDDGVYERGERKGELKPPLAERWDPSRGTFRAFAKAVISRMIIDHGNQLARESMTELLDLPETELLSSATFVMLHDSIEELSRLEREEPDLTDVKTVLAKHGVITADQPLSQKVCGRVMKIVKQWKRGDA